MFKLTFNYQINLTHNVESFLSIVNVICTLEMYEMCQEIEIYAPSLGI